MVIRQVYLKPTLAHLKKKEKNGGIVGILAPTLVAASFHVEQTAAELSLCGRQFLGEQFSIWWNQSKLSGSCVSRHPNKLECTRTTTCTTTTTCTNITSWASTTTCTSTCTRNRYIVSTRCSILRLRHQHQEYQAWKMYLTFKGNFSNVIITMTPKRWWMKKYLVQCNACLGVFSHPVQTLCVINLAAVRRLYSTKPNQTKFANSNSWDTKKKDTVALTLTVVILPSNCLILPSNCLILPSH